MAAGGRMLQAPARASAAQRDRVALHPGAWLVWLVASTAAVFLTSNPLYLSLALLAAFGVYLTRHDSQKGRALRPFAVFGVALAALSVPFNLLTGSTGPTVLATVPSLTFPGWFGGVTFGGEITGEALVAATARAIGIATLVLLAAAFNASIDHFRMLRMAPRALSQLALTMTVAVTVVPQAVARAHTVAEAQRLRGRRARGWRALPGLLLPTLQGALEGSVQRAEALDARGFAGGDTNAGTFSTLAGVIGLGLCAWGAFGHFYYGPGVIATIAMVSGVGLVAGALLRHGGDEATRLRRDPWSMCDVATGAAAMLAFMLVLTLRIIGAGEVDYLAYPAVAAPAFHPVAALAFLLLLAPALLGGDEASP